MLNNLGCDDFTFNDFSFEWLSVTCRFQLEPNAKKSYQYFLKAAVLGVVLPPGVEVGYLSVYK